MYKNNFDVISYDPTEFSGLKFRFKEDLVKNYKGALCIIFKTGSINIYRSASEEEVQNVFDTINGWVKTHFQDIKI
jgi:TATA-box binding protein (TBP) (component of TFIID and TFIIIB)